MRLVLLVDNEVAAEGESYLESTLGTKGSFTINLTSGGRNTSVTNDVTIGSMYAVTLDSQNITAEELQSVYDEAAALRDSVTEDNVYSEEYLGKLLSLAGKLYFAQVDIQRYLIHSTLLSKKIKFFDKRVLYFVNICNMITKKIIYSCFFE